MDHALLDVLLRSGESAKLDYKAREYQVVSSTDDQKSEIIKDIVAFANAWRDDTAYILIGVQELPGGKGSAIGVASYLSDAAIQQLVNSKTDRPIQFSCYSYAYSGITLDVIEIPLQDRPFYLLKDFGRLQANTVYLRRGSSTDVASPAEVASMGADQVRRKQTVVVDFEIGERRSGVIHPNPHKIANKLTVFPDKDEIPDYREPSRFPAEGNIISGYPNSEFYREYAEYSLQTQSRIPVDFLVRNPGDVVLVNPSINLRSISGEPDLVSLSTYVLRQPSRRHHFLGPQHDTFRGPNSSVNLRPVSGDSLVSIALPTIKPKEQIWAESFYVNFYSNAVWEFAVQLYAENLANPVQKIFTWEVVVDRVEVSVEEMCQKLAPTASDDD